MINLVPGIWEEKNSAICFKSLPACIIVWIWWITKGADKHQRSKKNKIHIQRYQIDQVLTSAANHQKIITTLFDSKCGNMCLVQTRQVAERFLWRCDYICDAFEGSHHFLFSEVDLLMKVLIPINLG